MTFDLEDFLYPLTPLTMSLSFLLGLIMGFALDRINHRFDRSEAFCLYALGVMFFIPLAINRGFEGSELWERFLANLVLWVIYVTAIWSMGALMRSRR